MSLQFFSLMLRNYSVLFVLKLLFESNLILGERTYKYLHKALFPSALDFIEVKFLSRLSHNLGLSPAKFQNGDLHCSKTLRFF